MINYPTVVTDILIIRNNKLLFGLLTDKWKYNNTQVYGLPGGEIRKGETIAENIKRIIKDELNCDMSSHKIFCLNANYHDGHFISIGVTAEMEGNPVLSNKENWGKWEWFEKDKVPQNLFPSAKNTIDCYLNNKFCVSE